MTFEHFWIEKAVVGGSICIAESDGSTRDELSEVLQAILHVDNLSIVSQFKETGKDDDGHPRSLLGARFIYDGKRDRRHTHRSPEK